MREVAGEPSRPRPNVICFSIFFVILLFFFAILLFTGLDITVRVRTCRIHLIFRLVLIQLLTPRERKNLVCETSREFWVGGLVVVRLSYLG